MHETVHTLRFMLKKMKPLSLSLKHACNHTTKAPELTPDHIQTKIPPVLNDSKNAQRFREFNLEGRTIGVTGGGRGLGLTMAEALMEAGANVWCLDRLESPDTEFEKARERAQSEYGGSLNYKRIDVRDAANINRAMEEIGAKFRRFDGMICGAGINHIETALNHSQEALQEVMQINYNGVFNSATAAARQMLKYQCQGSILLLASMSGLIANKGMTSSVYNSSKAAVIQLSRCLAMEWGRHGIRVNSLCPGHVMTPMVEMVFQKTPAARATWEAENMMGRLARPEEFRGVTLFALSDASTFMTGSSIVVDGGHTAW